MARMRNTLLFAIAFLAFAGGATSAAAGAPAGRAQALFFDALSTDRQTTGPGPTHVGHREIASGILRDATGRQIGSFTFTWRGVGDSNGGRSQSRPPYKRSLEKPTMRTRHKHLMRVGACALSGIATVAAFAGFALAA